MSRWALSLALTAAVALGACSRGESREQGPGQPQPRVSVDIGTARAVDEPITLEATGSFEADESSDVAPYASGRVTATPVDVGQFVRRGAILVRLQGVDAGLRLD